VDCWTYGRGELSRRRYYDTTPDWAGTLTVLSRLRTDFVERVDGGEPNRGGGEDVGQYSVRFRGGHYLRGLPCQGAARASLGKFRLVAPTHPADYLDNAVTQIAPEFAVLGPALDVVVPGPESSSSAVNPPVSCVAQTSSYPQGDQYPAGRSARIAGTWRWEFGTWLFTHCCLVGAATSIHRSDRIPCPR